MGFVEELRQQRWDDHRYYHHNRINQFLHLLSSICFIVSYVWLFINPVMAVLFGWVVAMLLRQIGHFFFEPKSYDKVNAASHEHKESVKVGYNLFRKLVLLSLWAAVSASLYFEPTLFGLFDAGDQARGFMHNLSLLWLALAVGALIFRTIHLFFIMSVQSGLVWFCKILTDPLHDVMIYYKSPYYILKGEMYDNMSDWYDASLLAKQS
ncbi:MAG: DUF962 domain-containing protein [Mariprofundaceae bacterium]|nr:DUF962 domain-containing protein [Mariprofundaceae bacterium]